MNKNAPNKRKWHWLVYSIIAVFYFWMAAQIPYTHDDWDWGLDIGLHQLLYATVNSRYVGNFFEVIMTRSELLKILIMGSGYFLIPLCLSKIAASLHPHKGENLVFSYFLLCNFLLFTMQRIIWRQVYSWVAGFANFGISAIFMMPWLNELSWSFQPVKQAPKHSLPHVFFLFTMSFCSQLFIENLAFFHVLLGLFLCVFSYIRNKKPSFEHLSMLLGSILGLAVMFSSSLYSSLFSSGYAIDDYRQMPMFQGQSLMAILLHIAKVSASLISQLYAQNVTICIVIIVVFMFLLSKVKGRLSPKNYRLARFMNCFLLIALVSCFIFNTTMSFLQLKQAATYMKLFQLPVSLLFFLGVSIELYLIFHDDSHAFLRMFTFWLSPPYRNRTSSNDHRNRLQTIFHHEHSPNLFPVAIAQ